MSDATLRARALLRSALEEPLALPDWPVADLDLVLRLLRRTRLLGRLGWRLREAGRLDELPQAARDQFSSALAMVQARERLARWELERLAAPLAHPSVGRVVLLKGCAYLLANLPNCHGRLFADVDLLVAESRLEAAESRLRSHGWECKPLTPYDDRYYRRWTHELPPMVHAEREVEVDLHHDLVMRTARLKACVSLLVAEARPLPGTPYHVPDPVDLVLHAMTHLLYGGEMDDALRELVDVDQLLRHFALTERGFWDRFWPRAEAIGLAPPAFLGLRYAARLLSTPVPPAVVAASHSAAPPGPWLQVLDRLVPLALFPNHPDQPSARLPAARLLLYMRAHWQRMPPLLLARHLGYKAWLRFRHEAPTSPQA